MTALPDVAITKNLSGILSTVSLTINLPSVSDPLANAVISGSGSFEDMSIDLPDNIDVRELDGDFELKEGNIAAAGVSARLGNSRIQEAAFNLDSIPQFCTITDHCRIQLLIFRTSRACCI